MVTTEAVLNCLNRARKVLSFYRKLQAARRHGRYDRLARQADIADIVTDLRHLAVRHGLRWTEVLEWSNEAMEEDRRP